MSDVRVTALFEDGAQTSGSVAAPYEQIRLRRELAIGAALLFVVLALTYANVLFLGQTLVSTANRSPFDYRFNFLQPGSLRGPGIANWHDQGGVWWQWEPAAQFFGRYYRHGVVPMWDPTVAGGVDTHVNVTQAQYFLPSVLLLLAGNTPLERDIYYLILLLGSGLACFALLRRNRFHRISAVFMGAAYMLSGTMSENANALLGQTYATLPMMVLAIDVLLDRLTWRAAGAAALVVGLCTYSSFLPIVISGYLLIGIQAVAYALSPMASGSTSRPAFSARQLVAFAAVIVAALGIAAFVLLPLGVAQRGNESFDAYYTGVGRMYYSLDLLPSLLSPRLFYDMWQTYPPSEAVIPKPFEWTTHFFYAGFIVVMCLALVRRDDRRRVRRLTLFFALASAVLFAKLMGIPPVQWMSSLPVFRFLHFVPYFSGAFTLALVGLAASGVETSIEIGVSRRRLIALGVLAAGLVAVIPLFVYLKGTNPTAGAWVRLRYGVEAARVLIVTAGLLVTVALRLRGQIRGQLAGVLVVGLLLLELMPIAFHRRYQRVDVWNHPPPFVQFLQRDTDLFRIHSVQDLALPPNTFQGVGVAGIASLGVFNQPRYTRLINRYFQTQLNSGFILPTSLVPSSRNVLDLLNVKYVVTFNATPEQKSTLLGAGFTEALTDGLFVVYRNATVWPRAYVAYQFTLALDPASAVNAVGGIRSPDTVVLEQPPNFAPAPLAAGACTVTTYEPDRVVISGDTPRAGMLVLLDSFAPGWSATVSGKPAPVLPANAAFRGVEVPAGRWEVTMRYSNPLTGVGLLASIIALALASVALFVPRRLAGLPPESAEPVPAVRRRRATSKPPKDFGEVLQLIYRQLYSEHDLEEMRQVWAVLVRDFFQSRIRDNATIVDIGAGPCWFINEVRAARRIAIDANPDTIQRAAPGVEVICSLGASLADLPDASVDHIFMSNFLEHLPSYREVLDTLATGFQKLKPGGSLLILQPNYRLEPVRYFDAIDHTVVLTDRNLVLALKALAYNIDELRVRFLPFTSKSRIPKSPWLVAVYLRLRPLQWLLGGQTFIKASRPDSRES